MGRSLYYLVCLVWYLVFTYAFSELVLVDTTFPSEMNGFFGDIRELDQMGCPSFFKDSSELLKSVNEIPGINLGQRTKS